MSVSLFGDIWVEKATLLVALGQFLHNAVYFLVCGLVEHLFIMALQLSEKDYLFMTMIHEGHPIAYHYQFLSHMSFL